MILNLQDFPTLSTLPITADELLAALMSPQDINSNVWERNVTHSFCDGTISVEIVLRLEVENGPVWLTVDALRRITSDDNVGFWIRSVEGQRGYPQSLVSTDASVYDGHFIYRDLSNIPTVDLSKAIGDTTCANNAQSPYLRCAVNPCGPCDGCEFYE